MLQWVSSGPFLGPQGDSVPSCVCLGCHFLPICVIDDPHCVGPTEAAGTLSVSVLGVA